MLLDPDCLLVVVMCGVVIVAELVWFGGFVLWWREDR